MTSGADVSSELAEAERRHAEKVQSALYRIAELASAAQDMQEFYRAMHAVVGELMHASNLYIALYDEERQLINFPYHVDELDDDWPETQRVGRVRQPPGARRDGVRAPHRRAATDHVRTRTWKLIEQGEIELVGALTEDSQLARRPAQGRGADGRPPRRAVVHEGRPLRRAGQGAARLRGPARRRGALACAGDRGDATAQRRARARSTASRRRSPASSSCRRSTTSSATSSRRSSMHRSSTSGSSTRRPGCSTSRTRSSAASVTRTSRSG